MTGFHDGDIAEGPVPHAAREALADSFVAAAQHLADGEPGCGCALHTAVAARAVETDRALRSDSQMPTPALVELDQADAADRLAAAAGDVLDIVLGGGIGPGHPHTATLTAALADFREATR